MAGAESDQGAPADEVSGGLCAAAVPPLVAEPRLAARYPNPSPGMMPPAVTAGRHEKIGGRAEAAAAGAAGVQRGVKVCATVGGEAGGAAAALEFEATAPPASSSSADKNETSSSRSALSSCSCATRCLKGSRAARATSRAAVKPFTCAINAATFFCRRAASPSASPGDVAAAACAARASASSCQ
eukprot:scaffold2762_cov95-Isochrysis_galbana.AAC.5